MTGGSKSLLAWRHVLTRAETGSLGRPGFQAIAYSRELRGARQKKLDDLVSQAISTYRGEAEQPATTLLLQSSPTDQGRCVLTRIELRQDSFDGRLGNVWAESVVVPQAWLARAAWDVGAAFQAVDWWGPERGLEEIDQHGGPPAELPSEDLPSLSATPRERLARLPEIVPDPTLRQALLAGFAQQAEDDREPAAPLYVVATSDAAGPEELQELMYLLPLAFPPSLRSRRDPNGKVRCLRWGALADPDALVNPDLLGLREAKLDDVRGKDGILVDLGGAIPPPAIQGSALHLAQQAEKELQPGDSELVTEESADPEEPVTAVRQEEAPEATEKALVERQALWRNREATEEKLGEALEIFRTDQIRLLEDAQGYVREQTDQVHREINRLRDELSSVASEGTQQLQRIVTKLQSEIQQEIDAGVAEVRRKATSQKSELNRLKTGVLDNLETQRQEAKAEIDDLYRRAVLGIRSQKHKAMGEEDGSEVKPSLLPQAEPASMLSGLRRLWSQRVAWIGVIVVSVVLLGVLGVLGWQWWQVGSMPQETDNASAGGKEGAPETAELRESVLADLQSRETVSALLQAALNEPMLRHRAAQAWLLVVMGPAGPPLDEATGCALVQKALLDWQVDSGLAPGLSVDGACGSLTKGFARELASTLNCPGESWVAQAPCILDHELNASRVAECAASWPFLRTCRWQARETEALLELLRSAFVVNPAAVQRGRYDLVSNPELVAELPEAISTEDAENLVPLAYWVVQEGHPDNPSRASWAVDLSADDWRQIRGYLSRLQQENPPRREEVERAAGEPTAA